MDEMEEWEYGITRKGNNFITPCLSSLEIGGFPKLKTLPDYLLRTSTLKKLEFWKCPVLEEVPLLEDDEITDIPLLSSLEIHECPKLKVHLLQTTTLHTLKTFDFVIVLQERHREGEGVDWAMALHIPHIIGL